MIRLKRLFFNYSRDKLTDEEKTIVDLWYEEKAATDKINVSDEKIDELGNKLWLEFMESQKRVTLRNQHRKIFGYTGIVATIALLIISILKFSQSNNSIEYNLNTVAKTNISTQVVAGSNMKKVTLSDGSTIHMNMGTTISMHKGKFNSYQREIWLDEGEAFFDIVKDPNRPFIVHTPDGLSTRVLGTSFNIRAYRELGEQIVSVKTGTVQVNSKSEDGGIVLEKNFRLSFNPKTNIIKTETTSGDDASAWRTGRIVLEHANVKELAFRLKQYYGVKVVNNAITEDKEIYTSFNLDTPLSHVISNIENIFGIKINIENDTIYFNK